MSSSCSYKKPGEGEVTYGPWISVSTTQKFGVPRKRATDNSKNPRASSSRYAQDSTTSRSGNIWGKTDVDGAPLSSGRHGMEKANRPSTGWIPMKSNGRRGSEGTSLDVRHSYLRASKEGMVTNGAGGSRFEVLSGIQDMDIEVARGNKMTENMVGVVTEGGKSNDIIKTRDKGKRHVIIKGPTLRSPILPGDRGSNELGMVIDTRVSMASRGQGIPHMSDCVSHGLSKGSTSDQVDGGSASGHQWDHTCQSSKEKGKGVLCKTGLVHSGAVSFLNSVGNKLLGLGMGPTEKDGRQPPSGGEGRSRELSPPPRMLKKRRPDPTLLTPSIPFGIGVGEEASAPHQADTLEATDTPQ